MKFIPSPGWLPFDPHPSPPKYVLPTDAVDAHCHVFGPGDEFPYAPERKYTPCDAGKEGLFALRDKLGFTRNVIVQASCHGADNRALIDALNTSAGYARGVATVTADVSDEELLQMHHAGVRAVRFNFLKRLVDFTSRETLESIAYRIAPLGWHVVVYFEACDLSDLEPFFTSLPLPVVIDHMGRPDVSQPVEGEQFQRIVSLMRNNPHIWIKVSCPERLSQLGSLPAPGESVPYSDVLPFSRYLVGHFPDRVLWGTDWPHPNLHDHMPDDGVLVDIIPFIAPTAELQKKILVDNPLHLYWPELLQDINTTKP